MSSKTIADLLKPVMDATEAGRLKWAKADGGALEAKLPRYRIKVWDGADEVGFHWVSVQLLTLDGDVIDLMNENEFSDRYQNFKNFFAMARRSAINFDAIAENVMEDLRALAS